MLLVRLKQWARFVKLDVYALYLAARDPAVPWYARLLAASVAAYALSPIDLIPDFIPVLGYLDDIIIVPLGILIAVRMIPPDLLARHRETAATDPPRSMAAAVVIVVLWIVLAVGAALLVYSRL
jgi:uncharacterized membrane protein YkvA (DUF1232 family)